MKTLVVKLAAGAVLALPAIPALAQQILVCFTLHNDLANFDRRAHRPEFTAERAAADEAAADLAWLCPGDRAAGPLADCPALAARADRRWAAYNALLRNWALSPLGGSDPVRLRIIDQMVRNGCPLPPEVDLLRPVWLTTRPRLRRLAVPAMRALGADELRNAVRPPG